MRRWSAHEWIFPFALWSIVAYGLTVAIAYQLPKVYGAVLITIRGILLVIEVNEINEISNSFKKSMNKSKGGE